MRDCKKELQEIISRTDEAKRLLADLVLYLDSEDKDVDSLDEALEGKSGDVGMLGLTIGYVSRTAVMESAIGDHVHFSVSCNDESVDPLDFCS